MFSHFFGSYLVEKKKITKKQFHLIMEAEKTARVKLGLIAVSEHLLTAAQADEINRAQTTKDQRFGDIAIEKGYLTKKQVQQLLGMQGNSYIVFTQTVVDNDILPLADVEEYLAEYQAEYGFTDQDIEVLKNGDIDQITPLFIHTGKLFYDSFCALAVRNIVRFVSPKLSIQPIRQQSEYAFRHLSAQKLIGDYNILVAFADQNQELLSIACSFGQETFPEVNEDALDAVCEFLNIISGLYAAGLSHKGVDVDMLPPSFHMEAVVHAEKPFYVLPITIDDDKIDMLISVDNPLTVK